MSVIRYFAALGLFASMGVVAVSCARTESTEDVDDISQAWTSTATTKTITTQTITSTATATTVTTTATSTKTTCHFAD